MTAAPEAALNKHQEGVLRRALDTLLVTFDSELEARYLKHAHRRARDLIIHSVYLLGLLYLLVVLPVVVLVDTKEIVAWRNYGVYPIAVALLALWCSTRLSWLKPYTIGVMYLALALSLTGTLLGAIHFDGLFPGQISAFETIYILIIGFSILRLPPRQTLISCLFALAAALLMTKFRQLPLPMLSMLLYFVIPLIICALNGYTLDVSARRNFANHLLLESESSQLSRWREQAEQDTLRQQQLNLFLERIAGNLPPAQLLERVLRYLIEQIGAKAGAAYTLDDQELIRQASWGLNASALKRRKFPCDDTLLGAALNQQLLIQQHSVPDGYLDLEVGEGKRKPATLLLWPIHQGEFALGIVEIASSQPFSVTNETLLNELHRPLAFALQSAQRRQQFLDRMESQDNAAQA